MNKDKEYILHLIAENDRLQRAFNIVSKRNSTIFSVLDILNACTEPSDKARKKLIQSIFWEFERRISE
jgi:hypothetical protein